MGILNDIVDHSDSIVDEARRLENEGLNYKQAYRKALKEYVDYCTDQNVCNHNININVILSPSEDIDNGEIYDIRTGETIRDLGGIL